MEPPPRLEFSNSSGGWLDCSASGSPQPSIDWLSVDGTSVGDVSGIRRVLRNGTLYLQPFPAAAYRQDIHSTVYRCVASNTVGRIISRDVQVRAGKHKTVFWKSGFLGCLVANVIFGLYGVVFLETIYISTFCKLMPSKLEHILMASWSILFYKVRYCSICFLTLALNCCTQLCMFIFKAKKTHSNVSWVQ